MHVKQNNYYFQFILKNVSNVRNARKTKHLFFI
jgi:hypothetical protein